MILTCKFINRIIGYIIVLVLFLQSCGTSFNDLIARETTDEATEISKQIDLTSLVNKELIASGGNLVTFYEQYGRLQADVRVDESQKEPNYKYLPVVIEKGTDLAYLQYLDLTTQQGRIQFEAPKSDQPGYVKVLGGALRGGMMEGDNYQQKEKRKKLVNDSQIRTTPRQGLDLPLAFERALLSQLPQGYELGAAYGEGDCFFDALAQWVNKVNHTDVNTGKYLRMLCHEFYQKNKRLVADWDFKDSREEVKSEVQYEQHEYNYSKIQYTADECGKEFNKDICIWGRPWVEGIILSRELDLKGICIIEAFQDPDTGEPVVSYHTVDQEGYKSSINEEKGWRLIEQGDIPVLVNAQGKLHFVPLWKKGKGLGDEEQVLKNISGIENQQRIEKQRGFSDSINIGVGEDRTTDKGKGKELRKEEQAFLDYGNNPVDPQSSFKLGQRAYQKWEQEKTDEAYQEALEWLKKSADQKYPAARILLKRLKRQIAFEKRYFNKFLPTISQDEIHYNFHEDKLGYGGMGVVFKAIYKNSPVAFKKLKGFSEENVEAFRAEAMIMSNCQHKHIISFIGYCPDEEGFLMEYMPKGSLWDLLRGNEEISWKLRYQIAIDISEGMCYLHDRNILHHDLKSQNILLDNKGRAKLTDFGISILKSENSTFGKWEDEGSYRWLAPEVLLSEINTKASDVYSYGMVLWQLGARKEPFAELKGLIPVYEHVKKGNREVISEDTPSVIKKIIELCWLSEPPLKKETDIHERPKMKQVRHLLESGYLALLEYETAIMYDKGLGVPQDKSQAIAFFIKAAKQGHYSEAQYRLGLAYAEGEGVGKDNRKAVKWFIKSAKQGHIEAQYQLGSKCLKGQAALYEKQFKWLQKAAQQGHAKAQYKLAIIYLESKRIENNIERAVFWLLKSANQGNIRAQYSLTVMYINGRGLDQDYSKALKWCQKAAEQGDIEAQNYVESLTELVENINQAEQGDSNAQYRLGLIYQNGYGDIKNIEKAIGWYQKAAKQGNMEAQSKLGYIYKVGCGISENYKKAVKYLQKAAVQGHIEAQYMLGIMYKNGWGIDKDDREAVTWYTRAAVQGHIEAQCKLGYIYKSGSGVCEDYEKAAKWYQKAADQGNKDANDTVKKLIPILEIVKKAQQGDTAAYYSLGEVYYHHGGVLVQDCNRAVEWYRKGAEQGHAEAQCALDLCYLYGTGVNKNKLNALKWISKAAQQGYAKAQYKLGLMYQEGIVVKKANLKAVEWFIKAAKQGHIEAQFSLGVLYKQGTDDVIKNYKNALKWYQEAADQGHAVAQNNLGVMYSDGIGVTQDHTKAVELYQKAAEQRLAIAQSNLGWMYENGYGIGQNYKKALKWYKKAARQRNVTAYYRLGYMYQNGWGNTKNYEKAIYWYQEAAYQQDISAKEELKKLIDSIIQLDRGTFIKVLPTLGEKILKIIDNVKYGELDLFKNRLTDVSILILFSNPVFKARLNDIHTIILTGNWLTDIGVLTLADSLEGTQVSTVYLSDNNVSHATKEIIHRVYSSIEWVWNYWV